MTFTFIHTADWQIGKPFASFDAEQAPRLRDARLDCIDRIADAAQAAGANHVLVAGDVFDAAIPPADLTAKLMSRLSANNGVIWHLLPGNHDPVQPGTVWRELQRKGVPPNVRLHLEAAVTEIENGIALLAAPLTQKSTSIDPTAWMDQAITPPGVIRIGLAHGSVQGAFGGNDGDAAVPIAPDRARRAGLDYFALGDWHGTIKISDRAWYSGTPETDTFPDNEPGHILIVRIDTAGATPIVERRSSSQYTWIKRTVRLATAADLGALEAEVRGLGRGGRSTLLQLTVRGVVRLSSFSDIIARIEALQPEVFHLRTNLDGLTTLADDDEIAHLGGGFVGVAAKSLKQLADGGGSEAAAAQRALMLLSAYVQRDLEAQ